MTTESGFFRDSEPGSSGPVSSVPPDLSPGRLIADKYELVRKVGTGAMGEVWAAKHLSLDEEVAIKLVLREVENEDGSTADSRFLLEARVASQLSRKTRHIVSVTDHGDDGPVAYLVMELLHGETLDTRLARSGPLSLEAVQPIVRQVARALAVAHGNGIVHRDMKPGNVFLSLDEEGKSLLKILDFGIAKFGGSSDDAPESAVERQRNGIERKNLTLRGFLLGTPAFMSPEQARGKSVDHRADVWALAVITYHLLTAEFPFDGDTSKELFSRLLRIDPVPIGKYRQDLPEAVTAFFARAFSRRIDDRFQSADELSSALDRAAKVTPRPSMPTPPVMATGKVPIAAGSRNGILLLAALVALIGCVGLIAAITRDRVPPSGLAVGATASGPSSEVLQRLDDSIPKPEPKAQVVVTAPAEPAVSAEEEPAPPASPATTAPAPPPPQPSASARPTDRSEVF